MEYDHARIIANAVNSNLYNAITDAAKMLIFFGMVCLGFALIFHGFLYIGIVWTVVFMLVLVYNIVSSSKH